MQRDISKIILTAILIVAIVFVASSLYEERTSIAIKAAEPQEEDAELCTYSDGTYTVTINNDVVYEGIINDEKWLEFEKISNIGNQQFLGQGFWIGCKKIGGKIVGKVLLPLWIYDLAHRSQNERLRITWGVYYEKLMEQNPEFTKDIGFFQKGFGLIVNIQDDVIVGGTEKPKPSDMRKLFIDLMNYSPELYIELMTRTPQPWISSSAEELTINNFRGDLEEAYKDAYITWIREDGTEYKEKFTWPTVYSARILIFKNMMEKDFLKGTGFKTMLEYQQALAVGFRNPETGEKCTRCTDEALKNIGGHFALLNLYQSGIENRDPEIIRSLDSMGIRPRTAMNIISEYKGKERYQGVLTEEESLVTDPIKLKELLEKAYLALVRELKSGNINSIDLVNRRIAEFEEKIGPLEGRELIIFLVEKKVLHAGNFPRVIVQAEINLAKLLRDNKIDDKEKERRQYIINQLIALNVKMVGQEKSSLYTNNLRRGEIRRHLELARENYTQEETEEYLSYRIPPEWNKLRDKVIVDKEPKTTPVTSTEEGSSPQASPGD